MVTDVWLSDAVEKTSLRLVGIVVFFSMSFVMTPPYVSTPSDSGIVIPLWEEVGPSCPMDKERQRNPDALDRDVPNAASSDSALYRIAGTGT